MKRNYAAVVIGFTAVFLALILLAFAVAPQPARSQDIGFDIVAQIARGTELESWKAFPADGEAQPLEAQPLLVTACEMQAALWIPHWLETHLPGWHLVRAWCVPAGEAARFIAANRGEKV